MVNLRHVLLGQYFPGDSILHRLDPRMKLLAGMGISVALFATTSWLGHALLAAYIVVGVGLARVRWSVLARGLRPVVVLVLVSAGLHMFATPGDAVMHAGPLSITRQGLMAAGQMASRVVLLLTGVSLVTVTTTPLVLTDGMERLLTPFRRVGLPAHDIAMMVTIALRFLPTLGEELDKIMKAQMARGADLTGRGTLGKLRALMPLLIPLFAGVFRRAEELGIAMEARGYRGGEGRTKMRELTLRPLDWGILALTSFVCVVAVIAL